MPVVHIHLIKGRTKEQKAAMADEISDVIHKHAGAPKEVVIVTFNDIEADSWAAGGTLFADK
jgi:4-oxalocrotonate tautomerase